MQTFLSRFVKFVRTFIKFFKIKFSSQNINYWNQVNILTTILGKKGRNMWKTPTCWNFTLFCFIHWRPTYLLQPAFFFFCQSVIWFQPNILTNFGVFWLKFLFLHRATVCYTAPNPLLWEIRTRCIDKNYLFAYLRDKHGLIFTI